MNFASLFPRSLQTIGETMTANATMANDTATGKGQINIIESLLPLLGLRSIGPMYGILTSYLGGDTTLFIGFFGILWAVNKLFRQVYYTGFGIITELFMCHIHVSSTDDIYLHLMKFLAVQPKMVESRSLMAETVSKTAWEDEDESEIKALSSNASGLLNFSNQEARSVSDIMRVPDLFLLAVLTSVLKPPRFVPAMGLHSFWWNGNLFRLHRKQESIFDDGASAGLSTFREKEYLIISCYGRNPGL